MRTVADDNLKAWRELEDVLWVNHADGFSLDQNGVKKNVKYPVMGP